MQTNRDFKIAAVDVGISHSGDQSHTQQMFPAMTWYSRCETRPALSSPAGIHWFVLNITFDSFRRHVYPKCHTTNAYRRYSRRSMIRSVKFKLFFQWSESRNGLFLRATAESSHISAAQHSCVPFNRLLTPAVLWHPANGGR